MLNAHENLRDKIDVMGVSSLVADFSAKHAEAIPTSATRCDNLVSDYLSNLILQMVAGLILPFDQ